MENVNYDRDVIQSFANTMYAKANRMIFSETIKYALIGAFVFLGASLFTFSRMDTTEFTYYFCFLFGGMVFGYFGYQAGQMKAFHLKLEAQRALCFAQMEVNSRNLQVLKDVA